MKLYITFFTTLLLALPVIPQFGKSGDLVERAALCLRLAVDQSPRATTRQAGADVRARSPRHCSMPPVSLPPPLPCGSTRTPRHDREFSCRLQPEREQNDDAKGQNHEAHRHAADRLLLAPLAALHAADVPKPAGKPNIVLFLIDDLGWRDLGCQGSTFYQTPNIDRLAGEGARFTDAYAACAVCSPTRAAILTGKYPARLLLTDWLPSGRWNPKAKLQSGRFVRALPLEEFTLAEALREAGYRTASIGKWHLGSEPFSLPEHHGFDVNIAGNAHGAPGNYFFPYDGDWAIPTTDLRAKWNVLPDGKPGEYLTDRLTDEAVKFIRDQRDRPFFLYFPHYGVHTPLQAKPEMIAKYEKVPEAERQGKPEYAAMIESVDESVGRVLATLKELGLEKNTRRHLHLGQRRLLQRHEQRAAAGQQGRVLRGRHPRAAAHQMARRHQAGRRHLRAGHQHGPVSHLPRRRRTALNAQANTLTA